MQPTYIPWAGYFNMIYNVDKFVFLDDVKFSKRSWQQRNKLIISGNEKFLTIPVSNSSDTSKFIKDIKTDNEQDWKMEHLLTLKHNYRKHPYYDKVSEIMERSLLENSDSLVDINISAIQLIMKELKIKTDTIRSSEIEVSGKKSEYLLNLCEYLGANQYLSAGGSKEYIQAEEKFSNSKINVIYHNFECKPYLQKNSNKFISHLSIIDIIANIGVVDTKKYIME